LVGIVSAGAVPLFGSSMDDKYLGAAPPNSSVARAMVCPVLVAGL